MKVGRRIFIFLALLALFVSTVSAEGVNESYGNTLWWRIDGTSIPTGDWDMAGFNITNIYSLDSHYGGFTFLDVGGLLNVAQMSVSEFFFSEPTMIDCNGRGKKLETDSSGKVYCGIEENTVFNESYTDDLYWKLDGANAPPSANWNMNGFGFNNVGLTTFSEDLNMNGSSITGVDSFFANGIRVSELSVSEATLSSLVFDGESLTSCNGNKKLATDENGIVYCEELGSGDQCSGIEETISWTDKGSAPKGFYPYGMSASTMNSAFPVLYPMEIVSFTVLSGSTVVCLGKDAIANLSCKVAFVMNKSGVRINPVNVTLFNETMNTVETSINLSYGDMILPEGFGSTVTNRNSVGLSDATILMRARKRC